MPKQTAALIVAIQVLVFVASSLAGAQQITPLSQYPGQTILAQSNKDQCRANCTNQMMNCRANCPSGANYETCRSNCARGGQACQNRC